MRVLITGATGFIGQHLTRRLVRNHAKVTALLRSPEKRRLLPPKISILEGDMSIFKDPKLELPEFDVVLHLAGQIFAKTPEAYMAGNYSTTVDLVECILRQAWRPRRFLFASSLAAAGPSGDDSFLTEYDPCRPVDDYGRAKLKAEEYLATISDFPTTSFRPAIVLGPGDENTLTLFKMAQFRIGLSIDGEAQLLSFVDVADLNEAIMKMMNDDSKEDKTYFVAHPEVITNKDLFRSMGEAMGHDVFIIPIPKVGLQYASRLSALLSKQLGWRNQLDDKQVSQLMNNFVCSADKLERELGWHPRRDLSKSVRRAYDGYRSARML